MEHDAPDSDDVNRAFVHFISAFNNMDVRWLGDIFATDVSLFAPAGQPSLIAGRADVLSHFERVFAAEPASGPGVQPVNLQIRRLADGAALVTFEFQRARASIGRRSIVFKRVEDQWRVGHIHASNTGSS